ncbi:DUF4245 domain-containing protein [Arthrobacter sp. A5]|uniref:DUF4245 domain-containing protein n=1 Tax=Arthrobacter sp. A5 TaxID=576926 RepID=UPI003DA96868
MTQTHDTDSSGPNPPSAGPDRVPAATPAVPPAVVRPVIPASAAKRANASVMGMILALLVTVAVVLPIILLNPHQNASAYRPGVDVPVVAGQAKDAAGFAPAAAVLPEGWSANYARWNSAGPTEVAFWEVGYVSAAQQFISLKQSANANPTWVAQATDNAPVTGDRRVGPQDWELRDKPGSNKSLILNYKGTTLVLSGSATLAEFDILAAAATASIDAQQASGSASAPAAGSAK